MLAFKIAFGILLALVIVAGIVTIIKFEAWFGPDPNIPSETESSRLLNKGQVILLWLLSVKLMWMMYMAF
jgi:hypothetical protein